MNTQSLIRRLLAELERNRVPRREQSYHDQIRRARAFRNSDNAQLKPRGWEKDEPGRRMLIDPLGERIPVVWGDLLFGEDPGIAPSKKADKARMDDMLRFNKMPSSLKRAEEMNSAEGEVWWRVLPNEMFGHAQIEFHSRLVVVPIFYGETPVAAAFVSEVETVNKFTYWYVEVHVKGHVSRRLYKAPENEVDKLGVEVGLDQHESTADLEPEWAHGLDMLAGRIYNRLGDDPHMGISDYSGIDDLLVTLNELTTIGMENARLTAKQRAIIPQRFLNMAGNFPSGQEILVATEVDQDPEKIKNEVAMIEFEFDATALIAYKDHTTDTILTRARIAPQLVGRHTEGAQTGPAMRARLMDSELAQQGKGKIWDAEAPMAIQLMSAVEALDTGKGGLGVRWSSVKDPPSFKRASALPEDPESRTRGLAIAVNSEFLSRKTAIASNHPEWDDARVEDEMAQIEKEASMGAPEVPDSTNDPSSLRTPATRRVPGNNPPKPETGGEKKERSNATGK